MVRNTSAISKLQQGLRLVNGKEFSLKPCRNMHTTAVDEQNIAGHFACHSNETENAVLNEGSRVMEL
jgi:hypothetical protein